MKKNIARLLLPVLLLYGLMVAIITNDSLAGDTTVIQTQKPLSDTKPDSTQLQIQKAITQDAPLSKTQFEGLSEDVKRMRTQFEVWITLFALIIAGFGWGFSILFRQNAEIKVLQAILIDKKVVNPLPPEYFLEAKHKILVWAYVFGGGCIFTFLWLIAPVIPTLQGLRSLEYSPLYLVSAGGLGGSVGLVLFYNLHFKKITKGDTAVTPKT